MIARIRARLHGWWRALLAEHSDPGRLAAACVVGAMVGCTPLFGLHFWVCLAAAWLLRLNKVTVYAAANISIPPLVPLLGFASVQTGERLLHGAFLTTPLAEFRRNLAAMTGRFFVDWLVGGLLVGAGIGMGLAAVVFTLARARQRRAEDPSMPPRPDQALLAEASRRYRPAPRPLRMYAWFKYRLDPCYRAIAPLIPRDSYTVDLGTGLGMLPVLLGLLGDGRRALGVDWDAPKLAAGRVAATGLSGVELVLADARSFPIPPCDVITLVDVLHYYDPAVQRALLERCFHALRPGGLLLVREGDRERGRGARWTRGIEAAAVRIGWNRGQGRTRFRTLGDLRREIEALGFAVETTPVAGKLHPGNVLLQAVKSLETPAMRATAPTEISPT